MIEVSIKLVSTELAGDEEEKEDDIPEERFEIDDQSMQKFGVMGVARIQNYVKKFCEILKKRVKNNKTKRHVVDEIIKTEEAYLNGLETLLVWKTTAVAQEMISDEDASNMFSNVDVLCGINTKFLNDLR